MLEWIRFSLTALLLLSSAVIFISEVLGVGRFRYVLNRMHAAAMGDTLGLLFAAAALCVSAPEITVACKLIVLIIFMWMASPVSSHLIALSEAESNPDIHKEAEEMEK